LIENISNCSDDNITLFGDQVLCFLMFAEQNSLNLALSSRIFAAA
jgi:hypothetical protein